MSDYDYNRQEGKSSSRFGARLVILLAIFGGVTAFVVYVNMENPPWFIEWRDTTLKEWGLRNPFAPEEEEPEFVQEGDLPEAVKAADALACSNLEKTGAFVVRDTMTKLGNVVHLKPEGLTDEALTELAKLTYLNTLNAVDVGLTDEQCAYLADLDHLRSLNLGGNPITSASLLHLSRMDLLTGVYLNATEISGENLELLIANDEIKILDLSNTALTDADMKKLAASTSINWLLIKGNCLTDAGILDLAPMPELRHLTVMEGSEITKEGKRALQDAAKKLYPKKDLTID